MGKVEKVVVLCVLFVVTLIIGVSLKTGAPADPSGDVLAEAAQQAVPTQPIERPAAEVLPPANEAPRELDMTPPGGQSREFDAPREQGNSLLNSSVRQERPVDTALPIIPKDWDLVTLAGLEDTYNEEFKIYTCAADDTFERVAAQLYGSADAAKLLRRNNEGVTALQVGAQILVPVRNDLREDAREHIVGEGEHLWGIAARFYGSGSRWNEIFEANRDVLDKPEALKAGMTLRIP